MTMLSLSLLGPFQVTLENQPVTGFRTVKERALLAYLAVEADRWHRREALAELFWPERPEGVGRGDLRQALFGIRRAVGEQVAHKGDVHILTTRNAVRLNPEGEVWLDVAAFRAHLRAARGHDHERLEECPTCVGRLQEAVELYRGDFLADLALDDSSGFQEWVTVNREHIFRQQLEALRRLSDACQQLGDGEMALRYARRQVDLAPLQESAHRQLMALLAMSGRRSEALEQYRTCSRVLADELAVEPDVETRALHEHIRAGELGGRGAREISPPPPGALAPPHNIPVQLTPFIGRETELAQIERLLANPDCRLLTVVGPGGVGKTRLALQAAVAHLDAFSDGVWFVPLAPVHSPDLLASGIAQGLGVAVEKGQDPRAHLLDHLRPRETLLVLDNFEHLLEAAGLLPDILQAAPGVLLLVTSRERLNYQAEFLLALEGLPYPDFGFQISDFGLEDLQSYSAVQLFVERAGRVRAGFAPSADTLPHIVRVCQLVEGLPLGIELAAAWIREHSCAQIARKIERDLDFLTTAFRDIPVRQRSLRAVFAHSWRLLAESEQVVYRRVSVFRGGFTRQAARAVGGEAHVGGDHKGSPLRALVDKSLLRRDASDRYDLHPLLRGYALEKLSETPTEEQETRARHSRFYLAFVQERENVLMGEHPKDALKEIQADIGNVRAAWEWAVAQTQVKEIDVSMASLARFYNLMGLFREGDATFGSAADRLLAFAQEDAEARSVACRLLIEQARFLLRRALYPRVIQVAQAVIELAQAAQDVLSEARGTHLWGEALWRQGSYEMARTQLERALSLARVAPAPSRALDSTELVAGRRAVEAKCLNSLAGVCWGQGDYAGARTYLEQTLPLFSNASKRQARADTLNNLGIVAVEQGDYAEARTYYQQALRIYQEISRADEGFTLVNLGNLCLYLGAYAEARTYYQQGLSIHREVGARQNEAWTLGNLGLLCHYLGEDETAREYSQRALRIAQEIGEPRAQGAMWMKLGHALAGLGQLDEAAGAYRESVALRRELGQTNLVMESLAGLARVALAGEDPVQALARVEEILSHLETGGLDGTINPFRIYLTCYRTLRANHDPRARSILTTAHTLLQERAARIGDEELRRSFLQNVAANQNLVETWEAAR